MQARRATHHADHVLYAQVLGERLLELARAGTGGEEDAPQHLGHGGNVFFLQGVPIKLNFVH